MSRKSPWEGIDGRHANGEAQRFYGVFGGDDYSSRPAAIFTSERAAVAWIAWQQSRGDDCELPCEPVVTPIEALQGWCWNSYRNPPLKVAH